MWNKLRCWRHLAATALLVAICATGRAPADEIHWAFRKLVRPPVPVVQHSQQLNTVVDTLLQAKQEEKGLSFSQIAERETLIRRATLDLVGLPPTIDEIDAFAADNAPDAYERLLDRLLASPHFGERWGRHWLDVVGYTDTVGFDIDANNIIMPDGKWHYRHYVIDAFNADKPFDRFVQEQVAGDELVDWRHAKQFTPEIREPLIATGFLRTAQDFTHEPESNIALNYYAVLNDTLEIIGTSFLGLTLQCARCHDHKFDPVTQGDYYGLMALLTPAYNPDAWKPVLPWKPEIVDRGLPDVPVAQLQAWQAENQQLDAEIEKCQQQISAVREQRKEFLAKVSDDRTSQPQESATAKITDEQVTAALTEAEQRTIGEYNDQISALKKHKRTWPLIQALYDVGPPPETRLLQRGNHLTPGDVVPPGFIAVLNDAERQRLLSSAANSTTSGRRTAFAKWLTHPDSPASALAARVMTNRLWQHLFGQGLVTTPENFGLNGEPPTHPELLEWLSSELPRQEWRPKSLIRRLMTSRVYRQTSRPPQDMAPEHPDPSNRLLWRMPLRQLDAEVIRDSVLAITDSLTKELGGPPVRTSSRPDGLVVIDEQHLKRPSDRYRRSVYLLFRRAYNLSMLTAFDQPFIATTCAQRNASAVVSQSLTMLNDEFLFEQAELLSQRVARQAGDDPLPRIELIFRLVLGRLPNERERRWCRDFVADQEILFASTGQPPGPANHRAWAQLCHALFNTSEFLYAE